MQKGLPPRLRTSKPCQNMLWRGLLSLQNDFWVTLIFCILSEPRFSIHGCLQP